MPTLEASLRNFAKARARWHPHRPGRSPAETRIIKRLTWQWFTHCGPEKCSARTVARWLGVSHTYVQKLVREFARDPSRMRREVRSYGLATFEQLYRAQEEIRRQKEHGL